MNLIKIMILKDFKCKFCGKLNKNIVKSKLPGFWEDNEYPFRCSNCGEINY